VDLPLREYEARKHHSGAHHGFHGSLIVGATSKAANTDTGVRSTAQTNGNGDFPVTLLIPGLTRSPVEAPGFKRSVRPQIQFESVSKSPSDVAARNRAGHRERTVKAETPLLDTSTTSMGQVLSSKAVLDQPLLTGNVTRWPDCLRACCSATFPKDVRPFAPDPAPPSPADGTRIGAAQFCSTAP